MKAKAITRTVLLAFVGVSLVHLVVDEVRGRSVRDVQESRPDGGDPSERKIYTYYFYGNKRCSNCRSIEAYAREAVETGFEEELKSGLIEWQAVNTDVPGGEQYVKIFKLTTRSVVLEEVEGGEQKRWKNLSRVWELVKDKPAFMKYIQEETRAFLQAEERWRNGSWRSDRPSGSGY